MNTSSTIVETSLRVRYAETDAMGIVYHANYLVWFEVGRDEYYHQTSVGYDEVEERGYLFPLSEAYARYAAPARYGEMVLIRTRIKESHSRSVTFAYEVLSQTTGETLATGWTKHLCLDRRGHVQRIPDFLRQAWKRCDTLSNPEAPQ
ncbi:MAG: acyl-CoA thioesterase [Anaerolineae bacterium]|nr:acyl-CoA thioesterase [Anaerolineae bacterium]